MSNKEDRIFRYEIDGVERWADPFDVDYRFMRASESEDVKTLDGWLRALPRTPDGDPDRDDPQFRLHWRNYTEACHRYVPLIRATFGLPDFDPATGEGAAATDVMRIWVAYHDWKAGVKKNIGSPPNSATPSDSAPISSPGQWAMRQDTGSISTPPGSATGPPPG